MVALNKSTAESSSGPSPKSFKASQSHSKGGKGYLDRAVPGLGSSVREEPEIYRREWIWGAAG